MKILLKNMGIHISFRTNFICTDKVCPTVIAKIFIDIWIFAPIIVLLLKNHSMINIVHLVEKIETVFRKAPNSIGK